MNEVFVNECTVEEAQQRAGASFAIVLASGTQTGRLHSLGRSLSCCLNYLMLRPLIGSAGEEDRMVCRIEVLVRNPKTRVLHRLAVRS